MAPASFGRVRCPSSGRVFILRTLQSCSVSHSVETSRTVTVLSNGFPQSLSGSETDVSTSNENLSREERYVVRHTARVEPQGQENQSQNNNNGNNRNSLKLEEEVEKVRRAHEELVGSCERRERLERAARLRLQADCRRLHDLNRALKQQVELVSQGVRNESDSNAEALRKELQNREMLIAQLITQSIMLILYYV
ncbi:Angiomotin [Papilio machaon]|uniref:Angiomotin n=1 Tax=Papilio machaon TaxID=76193 RepID=A0A0N1IIA7_PAPMA|nr:Angiomotin [Papilio machaon]